MTRDETPAGNPAVPSLAELLDRYLRRQAEAHAAGLTFAEAGGEVVPFEAAPAQPVDPKLAWDEALAVLRHFHPDLARSSLKPPADWSALVAGHEPEVAVAYCLGNYPQMVRNLQPLWQEGNLAKLRPAPKPSREARAADVPPKAGCPQLLRTAAANRLAGDFEAAGEVLRQGRKQAPAEWRDALANEEAALAWHSGRAEDAAALWQRQPDSVPALFNRGMAALFLGRPAEARAPLQQAAAGLPEETAWHHLARLYLALAEARG